MTEEFEVNTAEQQTEVRPSAGKTLAEARERLGLSVAEVARQLRLSSRQIEALEADDHASLPGETFLRGFLRNYAKLLQIDAGPLLQAYQRRAPTETLAISAVSQQIEISTGVSKRWVLYGGALAIGILLVALLVHQWMQGDNPRQQQPAVAAIPAVPVLPAVPLQEAAPAQMPNLNTAVPVTVLPESPQGMVVTPAPLPVAPSAPGVVQPSPSVTSTKPAVVQPSQPVAAIANPGHIIFKFERESWVNVTDGAGKMIFSQLNPAGSQQDVAGTPPFSLIVGNAHGVGVTYNGKAVDLGPYTNVDVARLTLK